MDDLHKYDQGIAQKLWQDPEIYMKVFEDACQEVVATTMVPKPTKDELHTIQVQLKRFRRKAMKIRELGSDDIGKLVCVPGIVINAGKTSPVATSIHIHCPTCQENVRLNGARGFGSVTVPRGCPDRQQENQQKCPQDPWVVLPDKCKYKDTQKMKFQESPESIPTGEMPRHIWLSADRKLVNKVKPGSRVNVIGIYSLYQAKQKNKNQTKAVAIRTPYIRVLGWEMLDLTSEKGKFTKEEEEELRELAKDPEIREKLAMSIAPAIWGNDDIKRALACMLFGGSRKILPDGMTLRGDINVLMLGDPSCGKSQFLKFIYQVAPIAVYTSGKGSSAAGLTASVIRDPGSGEFHLEGGAMVLADGGVVCIDEFDKMREEDRVAIHEAMEQQTISIAKAGITTTLNSRCSVLAAANPVFGRYDDLKTMGEQIDFQTTILSRFDLIFIIRDIRDKERDKNLASHIMDIHINSENKQNDITGPIETDLLTKYVAFARHTCKPRLTPEAAETLRNAYVRFRRTAKEKEQETGMQSAIPITVRQLEAIVRLSESLAKMELSDEANESHVKEAVRLFQVATLKAVQNSEVSGEYAGQHGPKYAKAIQRCERHLKQLVPVGNQSSISRVMQQLEKFGHEEKLVAKALEVMHSRGEIEYQNRRKMIKRKKV